ncbi:MAG: hypothetical protein PHD30_05995 [Paludibacter sp.]|nr:hypothetical protein [Paludibacter sp.]
MIQELILTTLPNQRIEKNGKSYLKVSVYVSPHLKSFTNMSLGAATDMFHWHDKIKNTNFAFRLSGSSDIPAELNKSHIDSDLYANIFHKDIKIEKFEMGDLHMKPIQSFPVKHIQNFLLEQVKQTAIESPTKLLPVTRFIDPKQLGVISNLRIIPDAMDEAEKENRTKPIKAHSLIQKEDTPEKNMRNLLKTNRFIPFKKEIEPRTDFVQFMDFHNPARDISKKINKLEIKKPEFEFHNILSVLNGYPELMRRLGFILDFEIPYDSSIAPKGTIQVVPLDLTFDEKNTKVSIPLTAYNITSTGFFPADKPNSVIKNGFVKINSPEFSVVQIDADGMALKTAQTVSEKTTQVADFLERKSLANINIVSASKAMNLQAANVTMKTAKVKNVSARTTEPNINVVGKNILTMQKMKPLEKMKLVDPPANDGLHTVRSAGIGLIHNGMSEQIANKLERNFGFQKLLIDTAKVDAKKANLLLPAEILYSDDVTMAYRMDIAYEDNPEKWYSLHQRKMSYSWFDETGTEHPVDEINPDEGYVELGIIEKEGVEDKVFVPETLARWEGWSLSVGRPGLSINDSEEHPAKDPKERHDFLSASREIELKKYRFDPSLDFKLNAQSDLVPGTLPKLRFGKSYRVRIRTVDMAGNSVSLDFKSDSPSDTQLENINYLRYEPLSSPITLVGNKLRDGEFLEQMVIRSNFDKNVEKYEKNNAVPGQDSDGRSIRYLLPPKNSQLMAETHGYFEKAFGDPAKAKEIYQIITSHEGLYERNPDNTEKIYTEDEAKIIYLPDPMAAGIAIFADTESESTHTEEFEPRMFSFFAKDEIRPDNTNSIIIPENWFDTGAIILKLEESKTLKADWDGKKRTFTVSLPKGQRMKLKISTFWREEDMKKLSAIWQLIQSNAGSKASEIEKIALSGQHWMISPSRTFELVHAVQQPVEEPKINKIIAERSYADTSAYLNLRFSVHGKSTDFSEVIASWTDPLDDGVSVEIKEKQNRYTIPEIDIYYHDEQVTIGNIADLKADMNIDKQRVINPLWKTEPAKVKDFEVQPGSQKLNNIYKAQATRLAEINTQKTVFQSNKTTSNINFVQRLQLDLDESHLAFVKMLDLRNYPLEHAFGDTRHRWVNYSMLASSRYSEYFSNIKKKNPDLSFSRESAPEKVNILSTARPVKPDVDYVIPAFEWQKKTQGNNITHIRKGGVLRVYLKRPWFSSGEGEKLAVILPDESSGMKVMTMVQTPGYTDVYTHWGADPLFTSELPAKSSPQPSDFRFNPFVDKGLAYPDKEGLKATAVVYPVTFDREKQMWYADIALNTANMYFPFIRLALARYQEHSLRIENTDVCLSNVVMSTMIQMVPERTTSINLKPESDKMVCNFKMSGPTYSHKSSKYGIREVVQLTVLDTTYAQPVEGVIIDNEKNALLENDIWSIEVGRNMKGDNYFEINQDLILPSEYKTRPFQIVVEEVELGPLHIDGLNDKYQERLEHPEETNRVVYADVFKIEHKK